MSKAQMAAKAAGGVALVALGWIWATIVGIVPELTFLVAIGLSKAALWAGGVLATFGAAIQRASNEPGEKAVWGLVFLAAVITLVTVAFQTWDNLGWFGKTLLIGGPLAVVVAVLALRRSAK